MAATHATSCIPVCDKPKCKKGLPCSKCARQGLIALSVLVMKYETTVTELTAAYKHIEDFLMETGVDAPEVAMQPDWESEANETVPYDIDWDGGDWHRNFDMGDGSVENPFQ